MEQTNIHGSFNLLTDRGSSSPPEYLINGVSIGSGSVGETVPASSGDVTGETDQANIEAAIVSAGPNGWLKFQPNSTYVVFGGIAPLTGQTWERWGSTIKRMDQLVTTTVTDAIADQDIRLPLGSVASDGWKVGMFCTIYDNTNTAATDYSTKRHKITAIVLDVLTVTETFTTTKADMVTAGGGSYSVASVGNTISMTQTDGGIILSDITFLGGIIDGNNANNTFLTKWNLQNELFLSKGYSNFTSYSLTVKDATADAIVYGGSGTRFINPRTTNSNGHALHAAGVGVTSFSGTQTSGTPSTTLMTDSAANLGEGWNINQLVGDIIANTDDSSTGTITANTATTITATMSSGQWDQGDAYTIDSIDGLGAVITNAVLVDSKMSYTGGDAAGDVTGHGQGAISYSVNTRKVVYENLQVDGCLYGGIGGLSDTTNADTQFFNGYVRNITDGLIIQMSSIGATNVVFDGLQFEGQNDSAAGSQIGIGSNAAPPFLDTIRMVNCITIGCYCLMKDAVNVYFSGNTWSWDGNATTTVMQIRNDCNNVYVNDTIKTTQRLAVGILENASNVTIEGEILDFSRIAIQDNSSGTGNIYKPRRIIQGASLETSGTAAFPILIDSTQTNAVIIRDIDFDFTTLTATQPLVTINTGDNTLVTGCTMKHALGGAGDAVDIQTNAADCAVAFNFFSTGLTVNDGSSGATATVTDNLTVL